MSASPQHWRCCAPRRRRRADWSGDGERDVLAVASSGARCSTAATARRWSPRPAPSAPAGASFTALLAPAFSGDGQPDLLARDGDGRLLMYRGNGAAAARAGQSSAAAGAASPRCSRPATSAATATPTSSRAIRRPPAALPRRRRRRLVTGTAENRHRLGASPRSWRPATSAATASPTCSRPPDGALLMYRGNGAGGWSPARPAGRLRLGRVHRAGRGGRLQRRRQARRARPPVRRRAPSVPRRRRRRLVTGPNRIGSGWNARLPHARAASPRRRRRRPPGPRPRGTRARRQRDADRGLRCTPPGGLLRSASGPHAGPPRAARAADRVLRPQGPAPHRPPPALHRAAADAPPRRARRARLRPGLLQARRSKTLRHKTVSRRFVMCG